MTVDLLTERAVTAEIRPLFRHGRTFGATGTAR